MSSRRGDCGGGGGGACFCLLPVYPTLSHGSPCKRLITDLWSIQGRLRTELVMRVRYTMRTNATTGGGGLSVRREYCRVKTVFTRSAPRTAIMKGCRGRQARIDPTWVALQLPWEIEVLRPIFQVHGVYRSLTRDVRGYRNTSAVPFFVYPPDIFPPPFTDTRYSSPCSEPDLNQHGRQGAISTTVCRVSAYDCVLKTNSLVS